jgi:hypothetical protein
MSMTNYEGEYALSVYTVPWKLHFGAYIHMK